MPVAWAEIQGVVDSALGELGQAAVLTQGTATHNVTLVDAGDVTADDMGFKESNPTSYGRDAGGLAVGNVYRKLVISAAGVVPKKTNKITLATGREYRIAQVQTSRPDGTDLVHVAFAE